jgi:hypothetical protein
MTQNNDTNVALVHNEIDELTDRILSKEIVLDINGLETSDHGRSCIWHGTCGHFAQLKDVLFCKNVLQEINGEICDVVMVFKVNILTGLASCHVGYVPDRYFHLSSRAAFNGLYLVVDLDYRINYFKSNRFYSHQYRGVVHAKIIKGHPLVNGCDCTNGQPIMITEEFINNFLPVLSHSNQADAPPPPLQPNGIQNETRLIKYLARRNQNKKVKKVGRPVI